MRRTSNAALLLAVLLSVLIHAALLFAPLVKLQPVAALLPPLSATLESLAAVSAPKPVVQARQVPRDRKVPAKPQSAIPPETASVTAAAEAEVEPVPQLAAPVAPPEANPQLPVAIEPEPPSRPLHPLPKHAQLTFLAYKGTDFQVGVARHRLEIADDLSYSLSVITNTTGLASLFKTFELNQQSVGILTERGLRPAQYSETKNTSKGVEALAASFDWEEKMLVFSNGSHTPLEQQSQDITSFLYQLSQLSLEQELLSMYVSNGKKLERYELAIGREESIETPMGRLRALPLRKIHAPGAEGLEIWLGLEYRLLPVKISQIDRAGKIAGEMVISEIRVADE